MLIVLILSCFIHSQEFDYQQFLKTINEIGKEGYCIEQISPREKAILALKSRMAAYTLKIVTFDNHPLFEKKYTHPIHLLSGGIEGFAWKLITNPSKVYSYYVPTRKSLERTIPLSILFDCKINESGYNFYYSYKITNPRYKKSVISQTTLSGDNPKWRTIEPSSPVSYLNDTFIKHYFIGDIQNFVLIEKDRPESCALVMEKRFIDVFGNHGASQRNTIAVNNDNTQLCLRDGNLLHFYTPQTIAMHTIKIDPPLNNSTKEREHIHYFLFCPQDKHLLIFFKTFAEVYSLDKNYSFKTPLPRQFKAAHIFLPENLLVMQSIVDTFFTMHINSESIDFIPWVLSSNLDHRTGLSK